jgi:hypothetical protein
MKEGINMENNKLERIIFRLLRILGVVSIIGGFLGDEALHNYNTIRVGHVVYISPVLIIEMIVTIILYQIFIRFLERHISITKKSS